MYDLLQTLRDYYAMEILFVASVVLVLLDYFFPVDYLAYIGYLCFALGVFFAAPFSILISTLIGVLVFGILLLLHRAWFSRFLTNATDTLD